MPVIPLNADIHVHASLDNDISPCAVDYGFNLGLFGLRHSELVERLLKSSRKAFHLAAVIIRSLCEVLHGAAGVLLRSAGRPAEHFRNEVFEAC